MTTSNYFTFVSVSGQPQPFAPFPSSEWEFVHDSTKVNGTAIWADTIENLMKKYVTYTD